MHRSGIALMVVAAVAAFLTSNTGDPWRALALLGFLGVAASACSRGIALYRAGVRASLPSSVGKVQVRIRPARAFAAITFAVAFVLPLAICVALLALVPWTWLPICGVVLVGCVAPAVPTADDDIVSGRHHPEASHAVQRICMRADVPVPEIVLQHDAVANAWTAGGRIHLTLPLLDLLDAHELEAVLAHEVAHLARRDAPVMEVCSAPSRLLLAFATFLTKRMGEWTRGVADLAVQLVPLLWVFAALCVPVALVVGWISRLSVLAMSRAREFSADAAAVALTGRPSALAAALMKLDGASERVPTADLRSLAVLCIVGRARSRLGAPLSTHPRTARRVKRLAALESALQSIP